LRQIDETYVQTGLVRFGYRHLVILGPNSQRAAEASECAAEQGAFWAYQDLLYGPQTGGSRGGFNDNLKQIAADLGLDTTVFNACLDSGETTTLVRTETSTGQSLGIRGTPAFLINGQPLAGAQPFDVFQQVIEAEIGAIDQ
jgi:protein-disulfide isomerase